MVAVAAAAAAGCICNWRTTRGPQPYGAGVVMGGAAGVWIISGFWPTGSWRLIKFRPITRLSERLNAQTRNMHDMAKSYRLPCDSRLRGRVIGKSADFLNIVILSF